MGSILVWKTNRVFLLTMRIYHSWAISGPFLAIGCIYFSSVYIYYTFIPYEWCRGVGCWMGEKRGNLWNFEKLEIGRWKYD